MRRVLALLLLVGLTFTPLNAAPSPWTPIAEKVLTSVVFLEAFSEQGQPLGFCSGFVIHAEKKHVLSAAHCDAPKLTVNGLMAVKLFKDARKDLMVLRVSDLEDSPAIPLAEANPKLGEEVAAVGYGYALEKPMVRISHISIINLDIEGLSGPFVMVDAGFMPGQSGGPVVNSLGQLVSIVQLGSEGLGIGVGAEVIKDRTNRYFQ